jgi:gamma-glutamyltranspeptidase / glutathione hydrolase
VTGASGGCYIITAVLQVISNVADFGMPINAAVSAPRVHHQHLPDTLIFERNGLRDSVAGVLRAMGQAVTPSLGPIGIGASIMRTSAGIAGMADPRVHGSAEGY